MARRVDAQYCCVPCRLHAPDDFWTGNKHERPLRLESCVGRRPMRNTWSWFRGSLALGILRPGVGGFWICSRLMETRILIARRSGSPAAGRLLVSARVALFLFFSSSTLKKYFLFLLVFTLLCSMRIWNLRYLLASSSSRCAALSNDTITMQCYCLPSSNKNLFS